ncbi:hypothetical protein [Xanthobacter flavus]|uniref:hypothetical protein n=1 Tax=Xanthobacter flavus TaxID=281 RepID=UPI003727C186
MNTASGKARRRRLSIDWPAAVISGCLPVVGYPALLHGGFNGAFMVVLGVSATYLILAHLTIDQSGRSFVLLLGLLLGLLLSTMAGSRALDYAASPTFARLGLLAALLFNGTVFGWALTATIDRHRRAKEAEAADRRRREREREANND